MKDRKEYFRAYFQANKEKYNERQRRYYWTARGAKQLANLRISTIRAAILEKLGKKCKKCGFDDVRALQVDHINGGGKKHIASFSNNMRTYYKFVLKDTSGMFQILCANCNWIKRYANKECKNDK